MSPPADSPKGDSSQKNAALKGDEGNEQSGVESSDDGLYIKPIHVSARYHADDARLKSLIALPKRAIHMGETAEQGPKAGFVDAVATANQDSSSSSSASSDDYPSAVAPEETSCLWSNKGKESQGARRDGAASKRRYLWLSRDASDIGQHSEGRVPVLGNISVD